MSHVNLYKNTISILEERKIDIDVVVLELACMLYVGGKSKVDNYAYLKQTLRNTTKISKIMHLIECLKDLNHPVIPTYASYVEAIRAAKNMNS